MVPGQDQRHQPEGPPVRPSEGRIPALPAGQGGLGRPWRAPVQRGVLGIAGHLRRPSAGRADGAAFPAYRVRVEFYWFNPSLGITRADANLIGAAWIDLANRFTLYPDWQQQTGPDGNTYVTRGCHAIVRCPQTWVALFENGGHECLVVRAFEPMMDSTPPDQFSATADRHVGQRNIAVVQSSSPAGIDLPIALGYPDAPADAEVDLRIDPPTSMEWLKVYTGRADPGLVNP